MQQAIEPFHFALVHQVCEFENQIMHLAKFDVGLEPFPQLPIGRGSGRLGLEDEPRQRSGCRQPILHWSAMLQAARFGRSIRLRSMTTGLR